MIDQILISVILVVGSGLILYAILGRLFGFHRPLRWETGGEITFTGELCCGIFVLSLGLLAWTHSPGWIVPALAAWLVGFISQGRAGRRKSWAERQLRATNSAQYPGVFDDPPPTNIDAIHDEEFALYDAGTCTYLGTARRGDLKFLIAQLGELPDQGPNDLFLIEEDLGMYPDNALSPQFVALVNGAFETRDYLVLRWIPRSQQQRPLATCSRENNCENAER